MDKNKELDSALAHGEMIANGITQMFNQLQIRNDMEYFIDIDAAIDRINSGKAETDEPMTRQKLSEATGISYRSLINYQQGKLPTILLQLANITAMAGMSFEELFKRQNETP